MVATSRRKKTSGDVTARGNPRENKSTTSSGKQKRRKATYDSSFMFLIPTLMTLLIYWAVRYRHEIHSKYLDFYEIGRLYFHRPLAGNKVLTVDELKKYDGTSEYGKIYLSIKGEIFDVTPGKIHYGINGPYSHFAAKDASRAYATGCFKDHLTHDLRGLTSDELSIIDRWVKFYDKSKKYKHVGKLKLPEIDPSKPPPPMCEAPVAVMYP